MSVLKIKDGDGNEKWLNMSGAGTSDDPFHPIQGDYFGEVERGAVSGHTIMSAMGERVGVGTTASGEDIWRGNDLAPAPTSTTRIPTPADAGEQMTVVSESNADNGATATGILTIRIHYLDAIGAEQTEDIILNGTTPVNTVATDIRFVNQIHALTVGSNTVAEGHVKIYKTGTVGLVYNMITEGTNMSLVPHRMVPFGKTLTLRSWKVTEAQNRRVAFRIRSTDDDGILLPGVFIFKDNCYIKQDVCRSELNVQIPALSIVKVTGWAIVANGEASCSWWGELIDD